MIHFFLWIAGLYVLATEMEYRIGKRVSRKEARQLVNGRIESFFSDSEQEQELCWLNCLLNEEWAEIERKLNVYYKNTRINGLIFEKGILHLTCRTNGYCSMYADDPELVKQCVTYDIASFLLEKTGIDYFLHIQTCNSYCIHVLIAYDDNGRKYLRQILEAEGKKEWTDRKRMIEQKQPMIRLTELKKKGVSWSDKLFLGARTDVWREKGVMFPVSIELRSHPHLLLMGCSGSGKSYALRLYLWQLLQKKALYRVWMGDYKNSGDFQVLENMENVQYAVGDALQNLVESYYELFCDVQSGEKEIQHNQILILDEYPSWIQSLEFSGEKKTMERMKSIVGTLLMMGRRVRGGMAFGVVITTQRPDAALFPKGARDNFMTAVALGNLSAEAKAMVTDRPGDLPQTDYGTGEGIARIDGSREAVTEITIPLVSKS